MLICQDGKRVLNCFLMPWVAGCGGRVAPRLNAAGLLPWREFNGVKVARYELRVARCGIRVTGLRVARFGLKTWIHHPLAPVKFDKAFHWGCARDSEGPEKIIFCFSENPVGIFGFHRVFVSEKQNGISACRRQDKRVAGYELIVWQYDKIIIRSAGIRLFC
jgi:hypothetical protein